MPPETVPPKRSRARRIAKRAALWAAGFTAFSVTAPASLLLALHLYEPSLRIHVLTDGARTATFVEMVHVGSPAYFGRVRDRITGEGAKGAVYLYEGVRGDPESSARLSDLMGFDGAGGDYRRWLGLFARVSGLEIQPQASFLGLTGRPDVNADLSAAELVAEMRRTGAGKAAVPPGREPPAFDELEGQLRKAGVFEEGTFANRFARGAVRDLLKARLLVKDRVGLPAAVEEAFAKRDDALHAAVEAQPGDVVITYGAAHYAAFLRRLGAGWKVVSTDPNPVFE